MKLIAPLVVVTVALLAGCTPSPSAEPTSAPSVTESATPTATPTPTPEAATRPALAELVISHDGLGPIAIGTDLASLDPAVSIFESEVVDCQDGSGAFTRWSASYPDRPLDNLLHAFESGPQPDGFEYVQIYSAGPHTEDGLEVGDPRGDLLAAYPGIAVAISGAGRDRYVVHGSPANLFFDVAQADSSWPVDTITGIGISLPDPSVYAPSFHPPGSCG